MPDARGPDHRGIAGALIGLVIGLVWVAFGFWKAVVVLCLSLLGWLVARFLLQ